MTGSWVEDILLTGADGDICLAGEDYELRRDELRRRVRDLDARLVRSGVGPGSTVAVRVPPGPSYLEVVLAVWRRDACVLLVDHRLSEREVDEAVRLCRPRFLVRTTESGPPPTFRGDHGISVDPVPHGLPADSTCHLVQLSSGSTGQPKIIGRSRDSISAELARFAELPGMVGTGETVLLLNSVAHSLGLIGGLLHALRVGATPVLPTRHRGRDILRLAAARRADAMFGVPFHYRMLGSTGNVARLPRLRLAVSGGDLLAGDVHDRFVERFGTPVGEAYGMTEVGIIAADLTGRHHPAVGPPAPGMEVRVVDGELWVRLDRSPYLSGHGVDEAGRAAADRYADGWLRTFDACVADPVDGVLTIKGRLDAQVAVGGLKVNLAEVEDLLRAHPAVREVVAVHTDAIEAYVEGRAHLAGSELMRWCRGRIADFKVPRAIHVVDRLPRTATGKLVRAADAFRGRGTEVTT
jgi:3-hydroxy-4-methylanthranilate adenylyltransferase